MTLTKPLTPSEHYARLILTAWYKRDFTELHAGLNRDPLLGSEPRTLAERERIDLIKDLAHHLEMWEQSEQQEDAANLSAALRLTHQIARWDERPAPSA
jgi:hypothetical protein